MQQPVRSPAVAGLFYPSNPATLEATVRRLLADAEEPVLHTRPRIIIVPHAGYVYSGPVAATAYRLVAAWTAEWDHTLIVGPSHFVGFPGVALPGAAGFETPLGTVPVDAGLAEVCRPLAGVQEDPGPHRREHSLEVQLPFLQIVAPGRPVLPVLAGDEDPAAAAAVMAAALGFDDTLILVSSDLSHYLDYRQAQRVDQRTAEAIGRLEEEAIGPGDACGRTGIRAALRVGRDRGWTCRRLDLRNSGDTTGETGQVVGYGAFSLGPD